MIWVNAVTAVDSSATAVWVIWVMTVINVGALYVLFCVFVAFRPSVHVFFRPRPLSDAQSVPGLEKFDLTHFSFAMRHFFYVAVRKVGPSAQP